MRVEFMMITVRKAVSNLLTILSELRRDGALTGAYGMDFEPGDNGEIAPLEKAIVEIEATPWPQVLPAVERVDGDRPEAQGFPWYSVAKAAYLEGYGAGYVDRLMEEDSGEPAPDEYATWPTSAAASGFPLGETGAYDVIRLNEKLEGLQAEQRELHTLLQLGGVIRFNINTGEKSEVETTLIEKAKNVVMALNAEADQVTAFSKQMRDLRARLKEAELECLALRGLPEGVADIHAGWTWHKVSGTWELTLDSGRVLIVGLLAPGGEPFWCSRPGGGLTTCTSMREALRTSLAQTKALHG